MKNYFPKQISKKNDIILYSVNLFHVCLKRRQILVFVLYACIMTLQNIEFLENATVY